MAKRYEKLVKRFYPVICSELDKEADCEYIGITIPTKDKKTLDSLRGKMGQVVGEEYRLFSHDFDDGQTVALLAFEKNHASSVKDLLWHEGISELRVPSEFDSMPLDATFEMLHKKLIDLPADLEKIQEELDGLISENRSFIRGARDLCLNRLEHFTVFSKVAVTKFTFIIDAWIPSKSTESSAWVPAKSVDEVRSLLEREFEGAVLVNELDLEGVESVDIPIKLDNKSIVSPFELLLNFFPPPKYGTVDPTSLVALFFPLFFGMILGDIAYGLVIGSIGLVFTSEVASRNAFAPGFFNSLDRFRLDSGLRLSLWGISGRSRKSLWTASYSSDFP